MPRVPEQTGFQDFIQRCDYMEVDENKIRALTMQNQQRARQREEQALRDKFLTKPLSEIVANDTEVRTAAGSGGQVQVAAEPSAAPTMPAWQGGWGGAAACILHMHSPTRMALTHWPA